MPPPSSSITSTPPSAFTFGGWSNNAAKKRRLIQTAPSPALAKVFTASPSSAAARNVDDDEEELSADDLATRLQEEGNSLAEAGRYESALARWDQALLLLNRQQSQHQRRALLQESRAQAFLELERTFPAIEAATQATRLAPNWPEVILIPLPGLMMVSQAAAPLD